MKYASLLGFLFLVILISSSCNKEDGSTIETNQSVSVNLEDLEGTWFRSYNNQVWGGHDAPNFERGESHITLTFSTDGVYTHNRTVLGLYEGTTISDTSAIVIETGTYTIDEGNIEIVLNKRIWWDSFYDDMEDFEESGFNSSKYLDSTFGVSGNILNFVYYVSTDIISPEQETPGLDKFEEVYTKQ